VGVKMPSASERPQWHRENGTAEAWIANLQKKNIDLVFATTLEPIGLNAMEHDELGFPAEIAWANAHPERFRPLFENAEVRIFAFKK